MTIRTFFLLIIVAANLPIPLLAQHETHHAPATQSTITGVEPQPLLAQAIRLKEALSFLGSSLSNEDEQRLMALQLQPLNQETVKRVQSILDPYCLAMININPESRVKVLRGPATAKLIQNGWVSYLVKVNNDAGVTSQLEVQSPNAATPLYAPSYDHRVDAKKNTYSRPGCQSFPGNAGLPQQAHAPQSFGVKTGVCDFADIQQGRWPT